MSIQWLNMVWNKSSASGNELLALMAIADEADDKGSSRADLPSLARKMRINDKRSVIRIIHRLEESGELAVLRRSGMRSTYYILTQRSQEEISAILSSLNTRDNLSPVSNSHRDRLSPGQIVTHDKVSPRVLKTDSLIKESLIKENHLSSSSATDDDDDDFSKILKAAGVNKRDRHALKEEGIPMADILAELARCCKDEKVRKPNKIMPMNLLRGDQAPAQWYTDEYLADALPELVMKLARPDLLQAKQELIHNPFHSGYTNEEPEEPEETIDPVWSDIAMALKMEMPASSYNQYVQTARGFYQDGTLTIETPSASHKDWVQGRLSSTIARMAAGCVNQTVTVQIHVGES